ncbi:hypothetical protein [Microbulbifer taiwanensis]|uniref:hypothetical protein n=1 Tax=Microbulbifer taiwanensis TaxID=986746 RepID=UPI00361EE683
MRALQQWLKAEKPGALSGEDYRGALGSLASWNLSACRDNKVAALAILTMAPIQKANGALADSAEIDRAGWVAGSTQFGSATLGADSPHYADQAALFVREELREVYFDRDRLLENVSRRYRPNRRE